ENRQGASGGSSLVWYLADVETIPGGREVRVEAIDAATSGCDSELLAQSIHHIQLGSESVFLSNGMGAKILIREILIHPTDCKPRRFEIVTAHQLAEALARGASSP